MGDYVAKSSESAFRTLLSRHVNLVYATALRQVGDAGLAEEITQNVFICLARKAPRLGRLETLAGWLHRATILESKMRIRSELRRRRREDVAASAMALEREGSSPLAELIPLLDEGLLHLPEGDRLALVLRFLEDRSHQEVGQALGVGEVAAQKRVSRALERLGRFFRRRGIVLPAGAGLSLIFSESSQAAPVSVTASAAGAGLAATRTATGVQLWLFQWMRTSPFHPAVYVLMAASALPVALGLHLYAERSDHHSAQAAMRIVGQNQGFIQDAPQPLDLGKPFRPSPAEPTHAAPAYVLSFGAASQDSSDNLLFPGGLTVDSAGNVYVSDTGHNRIQKFSGQGVYLTQWGGVGANAACFDYPQGLATDMANNLYVADTHNHRIEKFTSEGAFILQWGQLGAAPGGFNDPYGVAVEASGVVLVADAGNDRIEEFSPQGEFLAAFGSRGSGPGEFNSPKSVALDRSGHIYVADSGNGRIQKFNPDGVVMGGWGRSGTGPGQFDVAHDVAVDPWGNVYVADADGSRHNNRIQLFASDGSWLTMWGSLGTTAGRFNFASRVALDPTGQYIYVCDASNNRIQMFAYAAP